jgi:hypothetical protein
MHDKGLGSIINAYGINSLKSILSHSEILKWSPDTTRVSGKDTGWITKEA